MIAVGTSPSNQQAPRILCSRSPAGVFGRITRYSETAGLHLRSGSAVPGIGLQPKPFAARSETEPAAGNSRAGRTPAIGMIDGCRLILHSDGEKKRHCSL
jgi:hypothetical protein